jgi:hypothetical protein
MTDILTNSDPITTWADVKPHRPAWPTWLVEADQSYRFALAQYNDLVAQMYDDQTLPVDHDRLALAEDQLDAADAWLHDCRRAFQAGTRPITLEDLYQTKLAAVDAAQDEIF